jgi:phage portal protein BeeE
MDTLAWQAFVPNVQIEAAQFDRLKSELEETYTGARNAGRPMRAEKAASTGRR